MIIFTTLVHYLGIMLTGQLQCWGRYCDAYEPSGGSPYTVFVYAGILVLVWVGFSLWEKYKQGGN